MEPEEVEQRKRVLHYFVMLIASRRPPDEHIELIDLVNQLSDEEEVEIMAKSMVDVTLERGIEQGKKEYAVEAILTVLEVKFQSDVADKLKPFLSAIDNLQRLDHLHRVAAQASDVEAFTQALLNLEN